MLKRFTVITVCVKLLVGTSKKKTLIMIVVVKITMVMIC